MNRELRRRLQRAERQRTDGTAPRTVRLSPNPLAMVMSAHQPLDDRQRNSLLRQVHGAIDALTHGRATEAEMAHLFSAANITLVLVEQTMGKDASGLAVYAQAEALVKLAQQALLQVQDRHGRTQRWGISGEELGRLTDMIDLHDQFIEAADQRTIEAAVRTGYQRMRQGYVALKAEELGPIHAA